jgi:hypothetical protein
MNNITIRELGGVSNVLRRYQSATIPRVGDAVTWRDQVTTMSEWWIVELVGHQADESGNVVLYCRNGQFEEE